MYSGGVGGRSTGSFSSSSSSDWVAGLVGASDWSIPSGARSRLGGGRQSALGASEVGCFAKKEDLKRRPRIFNGKKNFFAFL